MYILVSNCEDGPTTETFTDSEKHLLKDRVISMLRDGYEFKETAAVMRDFMTFPFRTAVLIKGNIVAPTPTTVVQEVSIP